jgi:hypothetical protein
MNLASGHFVYIFHYLKYSEYCTYYCIEKQLMTGGSVRMFPFLIHLKKWFSSRYRDKESFLLLLIIIRETNTTPPCVWVNAEIRIAPFAALFDV